MKFYFILKSSRALKLSCLLIVFLLLSGCTKNSNPTGDQGSLSDSSIKPKVIFTLPADKSVGPFDIYNPGSGSSRPSFVLQFNKLMSTYSLKVGAITCKGFDRPVVVILHLTSIPVIYDKAQSANRTGTTESVDTQHRSNKPESYDDVLEFDIFDSLTYETGYGGVQMRYAVGKTYTVTIDTSLEDINGNHLQTSYTFSFTPEPNFRVIYSFPAAGQTNVNILNGQYMEVMFNSPLQASALSQITITPTLKGKWSFYNGDSTVASFSSIDAMKYNTAYSIAIPAGVGDNYGHQLVSNYSSGFTTTPFQVQSVSPTDGSTNVSSTTEVYFSMTGGIDTSTIRSAFTISPSTTGTLYYSGNGPTDFYFMPAPGFAFNTKYTLTLSTALRATDGTYLSAPFSASFTTQAFQVTSTSPSDGSINVPSSQNIYVYLNGPIDTSTVRSAFSISPNIAGYFTDYYGSDYFEFTPYNGFSMGTNYTVSISTALKALNATPLPSDYTFSFSTQPFQITSCSPSNGTSDWPLNYSPISVYFNTLIDTASARAAFSINPNTSGYFSFYNYSGSPEFTFTPNNGFKLGTTYSVVISTAMKSLGGGNLSSPYTFSFSTVPFRVSISPTDGSTGVSRGTSIEVYCDAQYDTSTVRSAFSISPSVSGSLQFFGNSNYSPYFSFYPTNSTSFSANTKYTVTISTTLKAYDGTPLPQTYTSTFTTGSY
ncbi:MAG TPA: Ig-like domain-containing protein [Candidatus Acidoferrales bacterium]|nr:Ig-like domain-containing protein [Candidatus Acidoferrales bacterium]